MNDDSSYPDLSRERDEWILEQRPARNALDARRPYAFLVEEERAESGEIVSMTTIFLTNRECPWHCLMCDLWRNTLPEAVPSGAIPAQIDYALAHLETTDLSQQDASAPEASRSPRRGKQIKLYNNGSFFDPRAIPPEDYDAIAERVRPFERVIVECHPALVGESVLRFREQIAGRLEVAMGLETVHPEVLEKLNKRMTTEQFARAADFLRKNGVALRVFILVNPPFVDDAEALRWTKRSLDFAFDCGATVASLIPTRPGNGALESLAARGEFAPPKLTALEQSVRYGIGLNRGRVFADVWDLQTFSTCAFCFDSRMARLRKMNLSQTMVPTSSCQECQEIY